MLRILLILTSLFLLNSCVFLSRSDIIKKDESETISFFSLEIIYDGQHETRDRGIGGFCQIRFHDGNYSTIRFRKEEHSSFYFVRSEPGEIILTNLKCMQHVIPLFYLKIRNVDLTEWVFKAHPGFVNYVGHVVITYKPVGFGPVDLFGLGGLKADNKGKLEVRVEDRIDDAIFFLNRAYPELRNVPVTKSLLTDISVIKHDAKPEAYKPGMSGVAKPAQSPAPIAVPVAPPVYLPNPYYKSPPAPTNTPYYNPYENKSSEAKN